MGRGEKYLLFFFSYYSYHRQLKVMCYILTALKTAMLFSTRQSTTSSIANSSSYVHRYVCCDTFDCTHDSPRDQQLSGKLPYLSISIALPQKVHLIVPLTSTSQPHGAARPPQPKCCCTVMRNNIEIGTSKSSPIQAGPPDLPRHSGQFRTSRHGWQALPCTSTVCSKRCCILDFSPTPFADATISAAVMLMQVIRSTPGYMQK